MPNRTTQDVEKAKVSFPNVIAIIVGLACFIAWGYDHIAPNSRIDKIVDWVKVQLKQRDEDVSDITTRLEARLVKQADLDRAAQLELNRQMLDRLNSMDTTLKLILQKLPRSVVMENAR